jgi:branched-subunit amino acid aminotransferase/4-amino-4-deoxychorismate lyase
VRLERDWVPAEEGFSLYIRPALIGTHPFLGLSPTREAMLFVVLSPVGPYFPSGLKPVKLFVETEVVRAYPGGVGDKKVGGNYAPTMLPQLRSAHRGFAQVLYVLQDGLPGGGLVGESGAMNVFFLLQENGMMELITPPLDGLILPGVTRDTVLAIARGFGNIKVSERNLRFDEVFVCIFHHAVLTSTMQVKDVHLLMWFYGLKNFRVERESLIYQKFLSCIDL